MSRPISILWLVVLTCLAIASGSADDKNVFDVRRVTFEGNRAFDSERLEGLMVTQSPGFLSSTEFHRQIFLDDLKAVVDFYHQQGYLQAAIVDTQVTRDTTAMEVDILIGIKEGELTRVEGITIFGNFAFPDTTLVRLVNLKPGDPFRRNRIQDGMLSMISLYADSGYLNASVSPEVQINEGVHLARVDFNVYERQQCVISGIRIDGLEKTNENIVLRELEFHEGEIVRYSRLLNSQRNLYLTGLFTSVFVRPETPPDQDSSKKVILIELKEKLSSEFNVILGYGSVEKIKGRVELLTNNLAGTSRQLGASVSASFIKQGIEESFTEPWTFGTRWRTDVNILYELQQEPSYDLSRYGGRIAIGRSLGRHSNASLTYRYEDAQLKSVKTSELPQDFTPRVRSLKLSYVHDTRDDPFDTHNGLFMEFTGELAGAFLSGTNTFVRTTQRSKWFHSFDTETVIASAMDVGWMNFFGASTDIPINERFFAGGPNSIRSVAYQTAGPLDPTSNPLGGRFKIVWNVLELRRAIYKFIGAVAFVDAGDVWPSAAKPTLSDVKVALGLRLRVNTPIGIARLDYGINPRPEGRAPSEIYFSLGQAF